MAKRTKITIETNSLLILHGRTSRRGWCDQCAIDTEMVALERVGMASAKDQSALKEWLNSGELHVQTVDESILICLNSLLARSGAQEPTEHPSTIEKYTKGEKS